MEETQSFRLIGTTDTKKIPVSHVGWGNIIYWEDIKQVFKDVEYVQNGEVTVNMLKDLDGNRITPLRIKHFPGAVLDVVLSTPTKHAQVDSPIATASLTPVDGLTKVPTKPYLSGGIIGQFNPSSSPSVKGSETKSITTSAYPVPRLGICVEAPTNLSPAEPRQSTMTRRTTTYMQNQLKSVAAAVERATHSGTPLNSAAIAALINSELVPLLATSPVASADESIFRKYMVEMVGGLTITGNEVKNMITEVLQNQKLIQDRLALIQRKAEAILVQNYEMLEYTIPRLFIVLPETSTSWDPTTMFRTKFRLRFICECGEHTKAPGSTIPHHLHLAKHEGYVVNKPTKFFEKYGPFLMAMLHLIKVGAGIAGHVVPALANLKVVDVIDSTLSAVDSVTKKVIEGVDYSIKYLEENRTQIQKSKGVDIEGDEVTLRNLDSYFSGVEGLEGVDLRQLGSYLKANSSDNLLGNLYRMTTDQGHVKWVCIDHYRTTYKGRDQEAFVDKVQVNGGSYEPQLGRVVVRLGSKIRAKEFFDALTIARGIIDLDITFGWEWAKSDIKVLENTLKESRVSILRLDLTSFRRELLSISTHHEALIRIIELPHMKKIHIVLPKEFIKLLSFQPNNSSHLYKLSFGLVYVLIGGKELGRLAELLKTNTTLTTLDLMDNSIGDNGARALSEALKTNSTLTILNLMGNSIGDNGALELSEALKINSTLTTLDLERNSIGFEGVLALIVARNINSALVVLNMRENEMGEYRLNALSEALKTGSTLTTLDLRYEPIGSYGAQALCEVLKTNSNLTTLDLYINEIGDNGTQALSEVLKINLTLTTLNLEENSIGDSGAQALSEALKINSTLTALSLSGNSIGDSGARALSEALKINLTLTTLDLYVNEIGSSGTQALSEALKTNSTLTTLNLSDNAIGDSGAQALSEALKTNSTLTTLDLIDNSIRSDGGQALFEALKTNSTLATLNLSYNSIGSNGAQALSEALKVNSTLTTLKLRNNSIGESGAQALSEALKVNSTLTTLELWDRSIGDSGAQALSEALKTNSTLTNFNFKSSLFVPMEFRCCLSRVRPVPLPRESTLLHKTAQMFQNKFFSQ